jgi:hypothetical protein
MLFLLYIFAVAISAFFLLIKKKKCVVQQPRNRDIRRATNAGNIIRDTVPVPFCFRNICQLSKNFLQEKAVEATKQEKERKEEKT